MAEQSTTKQNVFSYITSEEIAYQQNPIIVSEGYEWNMFKHIQTTLLYKASKYLTGNSDDKPFRNIIRPLLNLQYRAVGFNIKDITLFVNQAKKQFKSFLVRKFHEKWAREKDMDTFVDDMVESYSDFGGTLAKNANREIPITVPLQTLAFCDPSDILNGPLCEKHFMTIDGIMKMGEKKWENIEQVISQSESKKENPSGNKSFKTPGKYIEVYELHGVLPERWLSDNDSPENANNYVRQVQIISYYKDEDDNKVGVTLFRGKEAPDLYKFIARDKIFGRSLGTGGAEELFESQVWINYDQIRMKDMLDAASKVILQTADRGAAKRQNLKNMDNLEIIETEDGKPLSQVNTTPVNIKLFDRSVEDWETLARVTASATDSILGVAPSSGTPFKLEALINREGHSLHEYRKGKLATFLGEIYRDWVIPNILKEINKGQEFLSELDVEELEAVSEAIITNEVGKKEKETILRGGIVNKEDSELEKEKVRKRFASGGNKKFIKILKEELKDAPIDVNVNIVGKQKDLSKITDKLVNVFRQVMGNPAILNDPKMAKLFNQILEFSGLSPLEFSQSKDIGVVPPPPVAAPGQPGELPALTNIIK